MLGRVPLTKLQDKYDYTIRFCDDSTLVFHSIKDENEIENTKELFNAKINHFKAINLCELHKPILFLLGKLIGIKSD